MKILGMRTILSAVTLLVVMVLGLSTVPLTVSACGGGSQSSKDQVLGGVGVAGNDCNDTGVNNTISAVVGILSLVVGIAAIIMILVSGFKYITSGGDSAKTGSAKTTLIYALVGLAIAGLAQVLVHLVLSTSTTSTLPACPANHSIQPPNCRA